jgi:hypothetical protein
LLLGAAFHFVFQQPLEEVAVRPLLVGRLAGARIERVEDAG